MANAAPKYAGIKTDHRKEFDKHRRTDIGRLERKALYNSKEWKALRDLARCRDPFCVECRKQGIMKTWTDLDHIVDIANGGEELSLDNVAGLCHEHHSAKTAKTRGFNKVREGAGVALQPFV